jgi:hypothetical protein
MFKSKALWWTLLTLWILGATYWHVCKIKLMCDVFTDPQFFTTTIVESNGENGLSDSPSKTLLPETSIEKNWQHIVMLLGALMLGFGLGSASFTRKSKDLNYKLNRITRELEYYQPKH